MEDIKSVMYTAVECLNVRLSFGSFSFTLMQYFLFLLVLGIIIYFVRQILN